MGALADIFFRPRFAAAAIKARPRWVLVFALLALLSISIVIATHNQSVQSTLSHFPASATPGDREHVKDILDGELFSKSSFLPIRLLLGWSGFALLLFSLSRSFRPPDQVRFVQVFALEVHAEAIGLLSRLVIFATELIHGAAQTTLPPPPLLGVLSIVPPPGDFVLFSLLSSINMFTLWYVLVLTAGIHVLCGFAKRKAFLIVTGAWALTLCCDLAVLALLRDAFHLLI